MSLNKWAMIGSDILIIVFTIYLFFLYFSIFFRRRQGKTWLISGIVLLLVWLLDIPALISVVPLNSNIGITIAGTLFAVIVVFEGEFWKKAFFVILFDAIWMLAETLTGHLLIIYCEPLAYLQIAGSIVSKIILFLVIIALKKVFTNEEVKALSNVRNIFLVFIPIGSIYIMNAIFMMTYETKWEYAKFYSLISIVILLLINSTFPPAYLAQTLDFSARIVKKMGSLTLK